jgi:predicted HTH domain antitoxin
MTITLPDALERSLTVESARLNLAIGLFSAETLTFGQAAELAGLAAGEFQQELARRKIPLHYGLEELDEDLKTLGLSSAR